MSMIDYYEQKLRESREIDSKRAKEIGNILGKLSTLKIDVRYDDTDKILEKIDKIYKMVDKLEL